MSLLGLLGLLQRSAGSDSTDPSAADAFLAQPAPAWPLPRGQDALGGAVFPPAWPWHEADLRREDESDDALFYSEPRLVTHIDEGAIGALTEWYAENLPQGAVSILDVCSSWISHFPRGLSARRVVGLGMNARELEQNKQLTETVARDLNRDPRLPFEDGTFHAIVNAVSVDYLSKPLEVFREMLRVARPGALVAMSFSNRMFWTKAIRRWTSSSEFQRLLICGSYFHFAGFEGVRAERIDAGRGDPMYVVYARAPGHAGSEGDAHGAAGRGADL